MKPVQQVYRPEQYGKHNNYVVMEQIEWPKTTEFFCWSEAAWDEHKSLNEEYRAAYFKVRLKQPAI